MARIRITGALVISGDSPETMSVERGDVCLDGSRIGRVCDRGDLPPGWTADETIDGTGCALIPGMVNCHTHAAMTLFRGYADDHPLGIWLRDYIWPAEERIRERDISAGTYLAVAEMISAGITAFADMYFFMDEVARVAIETGVRARLSRGLIGVVPDARDRLSEAIAFAREWGGAGDGRITTELGPHAAYTCPAGFLERVLDAALSHELGLHIHVSETLEEVEDSLREHGVSPVRLLHDLGLFEARVLAAHCVHLREGDAGLLAAGGVAVSHNPISNMKLGCGFAPLPDMLKSGITVGLGTDGAGSAGRLNLFSEMRACCLPQKALAGDAASIGARTALHLATRGGARALGLDDCGLIEPGFRADLCLVDLTVPHLTPVHDPVSALVYSATGSEVRTVICDGRVLMRDRELLTLDLERTMSLVGESTEHLIGRPMVPPAGPGCR